MSRSILSNMAAVLELKYALISYFLLFFYTLYILNNANNTKYSSTVYFTAGYLTIVLILSRLPKFDVTIRSAVLATVFGCGVSLAFSSAQWRPLGWYIASLAFFHYSEYIMTAVYNADKLCLDSFLLNHSTEYKLAALASWLEFMVEMCLVPGMKQQSLVNMMGLAMVVFGEGLRKLAMVTAKSNFTHLVQYKKYDHHVLVKCGIYAWFRHPAYVGWFWWSIGTQVVLCNPVCLVAYTLASWRFFKERIYEEEITLLQFFGEDYMKYQEQVGTGLPFISGFHITENLAQ